MANHPPSASRPWPSIRQVARRTNSTPAMRHSSDDKRGKNAKIANAVTQPTGLILRLCHTKPIVDPGRANAPARSASSSKISQVVQHGHPQGGPLVYVGRLKGTTQMTATLNPPATAAGAAPTTTATAGRRRTNWIRILGPKECPVALPLVDRLVDEADARYLGWRRNAHYLVHNASSH